MIRRIYGIAITVSVLIGAPRVAAFEPFKFLAFGDMPYAARDYALLVQPRLEDEIFSFAVFYGDMKSGGAECTTELYLKNRDHIFGVTNRPIFAALGDNGWTDCDRFGGYELEKQTEIRSVMYDADYLPERRLQNSDTWQIKRSQNFPEIAAWRYGSVQFATFHIVGTNNGRTEIDCHDPDNREKLEAAALDAVDARDTANLNWLDQVFKDTGNALGPAEAIVLVMQADVTGDIDDRKYVYAQDYEAKCPFKRNTPKFSRKELSALEPCNEENRTFCDPYALFFDALKHRAETFRKPVLVVHGSTYAMCVQQAFMGLDNLIRFNGPGDGVSDLAFVSLQDGAEGIEFGFTAHKTGNVISNSCS